MKIAFESSEIIPPMANILSILTDSARICVDDIHYDATEGTVVILMKRKELLGFKKPLLGSVRPIYGRKWIDSVLTVRQVNEMNLQVDNRLVDECNSCFTVMVGLTVMDNLLNLRSLEEAQGETLCHVFITVNKINIECADV